MKNISSLIDAYLEDRKLAWAPSTLKSERYRLVAVAEAMDGKAETLWDALASYKPYARATTWTRITDFWAWGLAAGHFTGANQYEQFRKKNALQFKNVYQRRTPTISFEAAQQAVAQIANEQSRAKAMQLLQGGLRYTESLSLAGGSVVGKGGKRRDVYSSETPNFKHTYDTFRRHLAAVGLKPHDLRKLFATGLVAAGANEFQLCEVMGWASIATASSYISNNKSELLKLVHMVQGGPTHESAGSTKKQVS
jgi:integrase